MINIHSQIKAVNNFKQRDVSLLEEISLNSNHGLSNMQQGQSIGKKKPT